MRRGSLEERARSTATGIGNRSLANPRSALSASHSSCTRWNHSDSWSQASSVRGLKDKHTVGLTVSGSAQVMSFCKKLQV